MSALMLERILSRRQIDADTGCWRWTGSCDTGGYGLIKYLDRLWKVHRVVYTLHFGPIPDGHEVDHVHARGCRYRDCFNPAHLEAVTHRENVLRGTSMVAVNAVKTHCNRGHEFTSENTRMEGTFRRCRACIRLARGQIERKAS